jgi:hypothetical protein
MRVLPRLPEGVRDHIKSKVIAKVRVALSGCLVTGAGALHALSAAVHALFADGGVL